MQKADQGSQYNRLENAILFCSVGEKNKDRLLPTLPSRLDRKLQILYAVRIAQELERHTATLTVVVPKL